VNSGAARGPDPAGVRRLPRDRRWLPWVLAGSATVVVTVATLIGLSDAGEGFASGLHPAMAVVPFVLAISYAFLGGLILRERPGHGLGRLMAWFGIGFAVGAMFDNYVFHEPALPAREWVQLGSGVGYFFFVVPLVVLTPLLFPTGRLPSPRWRVPLAVATVGLTVVVLGNLIDPMLHQDVGGENPLAVPALEPWIDTVTGLGMVPVALLAVAGLVDVIRRARRSAGVERLQMRWFAVGATAVFVGVAGLAISYELVGIELALTFFALGAPILPVCLAIAILRYRLYEIDRVISRSVAYVLVTLTLVGLYVLGVVGLGAVARGLTGGGGGDLVVAASTLLVAAAFGPVRRRVQSVVDRRFNRARYDAQRTLEVFAQRLRDEVDLEVLTKEMVEVIGGAVQPRLVGLWFSPEVRP
jgi:hypothetical protein